MQKDAKSKGISLMQWIEDAVKTKLSALTDREWRTPVHSKHDACLAIFDRGNQEPVRKVPISEEQFFELWKNCNNGFVRGGKFTDEIVADADPKTFVISQRRRCGSME